MFLPSKRVAKPSSAARSDLMKKVRQKDTGPELVVRRYLHVRGLRFRLNSRQLPGRPDIVLPRRKSVVFVHGCFWHGHDCKHGQVKSKSNTDFWTAKIAANRARDARVARELRMRGWSVETIWECQIWNEAPMSRLAARLLAR